MRTLKDLRRAHSGFRMICDFLLVNENFNENTSKVSDVHTVDSE
jgi:hypothetical protein